LRLSKSGMNRFILRGLIFISLFTPLAFACTEGSCLEETQSYLKATFYTTVNDKSVAAAPDTLSMYGVGSDSILYKKATAVKVALIPLNSSADSSSFILIINAITDTIKFRYSSYPHLISKECGYTYYHHLDEIIHSNNNIGDFINNSTITNLNV
jgi:hypothetical protein